MRDWGLKALSLFIAVAMGVFVQSESNTSVITFLVPIEIRNVAQDKVVIDPGASQAEVTVRGPSFLAARLYSSPPSFKISLPDNVGGSYQASLNKDDLLLPGSMRVLKILPSDVLIRVDQRISINAPVQVRQIGALAKGLKLVSMLPSPERIELQGARSELEGVKDIDTAPINLTEVQGDEERDVAIVIPGAHSTAGINRIKVRIEVEYEQVEKKFDDVALKILAPNSLGALAANPSTVDITVSAPAEVVTHLAAKQLMPTVQIGDAAQLNQPLKPIVDLPPDISLVLVNPETVRVLPLGKRR